jgi:hypothetical protein
LKVVIVPVLENVKGRTVKLNRSSVPKDITRLRLFVVSYAPLWLMLAFRAVAVHGGWHWSNRMALALAFALLAGWGFLDGWRLVKGTRRAGAVTFFLSNVDDQGGNAAGYLASYLLPFLGLAPTGWGDWGAYAIYLVVAGIVFIRTDLALVNPTLYILGWRVVSARAFLDADRSPDQQVGDSPVIVVCRRPSSLSSGPVDMVTLAGCYVTKREPGV